LPYPKSPRASSLTRTDSGAAGSFVGLIATPLYPLIKVKDRLGLC
jgi:hypothetical protein